nr:hypothetical protein [Tanacetum cinerariifolium]
KWHQQEEPQAHKALIDQGVANALAVRDADGSQNSDDSHNSGTGSRRTERTTLECTYTDFLKCQPINFKVENQVKFATSTLYGVSLTWWKSHVKTVGQDAAHSMPWSTLMKMMTTKSWLCCASNPNTMQDAIEFATELMDKKIRTFAKRQTKNKRKSGDNLRNNQNQQQQNKRQNTGRAYIVGHEEKKPYGGSKPLCSKGNYHHDGPCAPKCHKCNRVGHLARDCRSPANTNTANNKMGTGAGQEAICFECGAQGHFKRECIKLKNNNHSNQGGNGNAPAKVYVVGNARTNLDSNV